MRRRGNAAPVARRGRRRERGGCARRQAGRPRPAGRDPGGMLPGMAIRTELTVRLENSPGALARLCQALRDEKVNVLALSLDGSGVVHLVPDNPVHAADEREVLYVTVPNGPGALASATRLLSAAAVNIDYAFASALADHDMTAVVVGVDDAQRASTAAGR